MVSKFFHFAVSRDSVLPSVYALQKYASDNEVYDLNYYLKSLSMRPKLNPYRSDLFETFTTDILESYDFLGISERMDESLVVLQLLLGLQTEDLLYLSTKTSGTYDYFPAKQICTVIPKATVDLEMKKWLYSEEFESYVLGDVLMYQAADKSLDRTIEMLGKDKVQRALVRLRWTNRPDRPSGEM
jgi:hypothetical protein